MRATLRALLCAALAASGGCDSGTQSGGTTDGGAGSGGSAHGGTGGSSAAGGTCKSDFDCQLAADCCGTCQAVVTGTAANLCKAACELDECQATGVISAQCSDTACAVAYNCSDAYHDANCEPPPSCAPGELPVSARHYSIPPGPKCWTGSCVPSSSCEQVSDCSSCEAGAYCVEYLVVGGAAGGSGVSTYRCRRIPAACAGTVNCNCAGVCDTQSDCEDTASGVRCTTYAP